MIALYCKINFPGLISHLPLAPEFGILNSFLLPASQRLNFSRHHQFTKRLKTTLADDKVRSVLKSLLLLNTLLSFTYYYILCTIFRSLQHPCKKSPGREGNETARMQKCLIPIRWRKTTAPLTTMKRGVNFTESSEFLKKTFKRVRN